MLELRQQEVIEVLYIFDDVNCVDMWAVAYDEDGLLDDTEILTDIHYEFRTIWVNKRLRRLKQKRQQEIVEALRIVCEQCGHGSFTVHGEQEDADEAF